MSEEDYLTPIVAQVLVGVVVIGGALIISRLMDRYIDRKLRRMEWEANLKAAKFPK